MRYGACARALCIHRVQCVGDGAACAGFPAALARRDRRCNDEEGRREAAKSHQSMIWTGATTFVSGSGDAVVAGDDEVCLQL
jgi:hypothetical protein